MNQVFKTQKIMRFREADPAQIMFFANIFAFSHDVFEDFVVHAGFTWSEWFQNKSFAIPIRHTEADYRAPFQAGHSYDVSVSILSFGESSFKVRYVWSSGKVVHAVVHMVHTVIDISSKSKAALPDKVKSAFSPYLEVAT